MLVEHSCQMLLTKLMIQLCCSLRGFQCSFQDCNSLTKLHNARLTDDLTVKMFVSIMFFVQLFGLIKTVCSASEENIIC